MPLSVLPDLVFPITRAQSGPLMSAVVQLNTIYAGIDERSQKAIGILLKAHELFMDSDGGRDYITQLGQGKLFQDSESLVGDGTGISTRIGDMRAAGLAIDFHNVLTKQRKRGYNFFSGEVKQLREMAIRFSQLPPRKLDEISLMLSYLRKDSSLVDNATYGGEGDE